MVTITGRQQIFMHTYCMCYLILHASGVGYVRYQNTVYLAVPLVSFLTGILCVHTLYIYICYLILHGSRVGYVRYRNTAYLAVPLVLLLTDILCIHICVHTVYIFICY
jgi:hypothetical protein